MSERSLSWRIWGGVFLAFALILAEVLHLWSARDTTVREIACADPQAGCSLQGIGLSGSLRFAGEPSALHPFELRVLAPEARTVHANFTMVGMDMGLNRYQLSADKHSWNAKIVLPVCVSGRRDWVLDLYIDGVIVRLPFRAGK